MNHISNIMNDIARSQMNYRAKFMEKFGLRGFHAKYIVSLCTEPGISQEQLTRRINTNKSNVARQLAVLEETGYVFRRTDSEDKRILRVYPTEKAKEIFPVIEAKKSEWDEFVTCGLSAEEKTQIAIILKKIKQRADAFTEGER